MRIERLFLQNVRRFEEFRCEFSSGFNVIVGGNGAGKTTILEVLARVLSAFTPEPLPLVRPREVRETLTVADSLPVRLVHRPWFVTVGMETPTGQRVETIDGDARSPKSSLAWAAERHAEVLRIASGSLELMLPLLCSFSPWREPPHRRKVVAERSGPAARLDGYADAFDLHADFRSFAAWFRSMDERPHHGNGRSGAVEAVRNAVMGCIPGCTDLRWVSDFDDLVVTLEEPRSDGPARDVTQPIWRLSDGYRTMLAMVGELAWRAAVLNPQLGAEAVRAVRGVVLIDELDLHLHPAWQRRVVGDLRRTFPGVQFIVTTHSPLIVQSVNAEEVVNLDRPTASDPQLSSVEEIIEREMGVPQVQRSALFQEKVKAARRYLELLRTNPDDERGVQSLKDALDALQVQFGHDPVYVAGLLQKRAAAGLS